MARVKTTYTELLAMAKSYGIDKNALFIAAAEQYDLQQRVIMLLKESIDQNSLTTKKSYIKGESNDYTAPLVKELPKHSDAANRTAAVILDIILKLGKPPAEDKEMELDLDDI